MGACTIESLLRSAIGRLRESGSCSPRLDCELLLAHVLGVDRTRLFSRSDRTVAESEIACFEALVERRAAHEPVAYLTGEAYFRRLRLAVDRAVLIPRPETEELVEAALALLARRPAWRGPEVAPALVADVGTGSGAIALSLAQEAGLRVLATDVSAEALSVAAANAAATGLADLVDLRRADLLTGVADRSLHLVVSNPPYVSSGDYRSLAADVRLYEPAAALEAGPDGLDVIRRLIVEAARALRPGGTLLLEVGYDQAGAVCGLMRTAGFVSTAVHRDLSGKDRIVEATLSGVCAMALPAALPESAMSREAWVQAVRDALAAGAVIGVPTDTVYGIGARWDSADGVRRMFAAKGRPPQQPVQVLFSSVESIRRALPDLDGEAAKVLAALLPGPYTFVVATTVARPEMVGTPDSLGVRVPDFAPLQALLATLDVPIAATSANLSGHADARALAEVDPVVLAHCSVAFDPTLHDAEGICHASPPAVSTREFAIPPALAKPSTVVDLRPLTKGGSPIILREGAVSAADLLGRIAALA